MVDLLLDLFLQVFLLHYFPLTQAYFLLVLLAALVQFLSFLESAVFAGARVYEGKMLICWSQKCLHGDDVFRGGRRRDQARG